MQVNDSDLRETLETSIEECQEHIREYRYRVRWYYTWFYLFWINVCISIGSFSSSSFLDNTFPFILGGITAVIGGVAGIGMLVYSNDSYANRTRVEILRNNQKYIRETKQQIKKYRRRLKQYEKYVARQLPTLSQNAEYLPLLIAKYRKQANHYRWRFIMIQVTIILLSVIITSLSGGWLDRYILLPWVVPVGSGLVSLFSTFLLFFKPREKGANLQETADAMDLEFKACGLGIDPYSGLSQDEKLLLLAKRTEALRRDQLQRQQQLEQASQSEPKLVQPGK